MAAGLHQEEPATVEIPEQMRAWMERAIRQGITEGLQQMSRPGLLQMAPEHELLSARSSPRPDPPHGQVPSQRGSPLPEGELEEEIEVLDQSREEEEFEWGSTLHGEPLSEIDPMEGEMSEDEGLTPDQSTFVGLFKPHMFKSILLKAKNTSGLSVQSPSALPSPAEGPEDAIFRQPMVEEEVIPAPPIFHVLVSNQLVSTGAPPAPSNQDKRFFNLESSFCNLLNTLEVDEPIVDLASSSSPSDPLEGLKPEDKRSKLALHNVTAKAHVNRESTLQFLTFKVMFLVAITSARRISKIAALSVRKDLCIFHADQVVLRPDPTFLPKVNSTFHRAQELMLLNFCPNPSQEREKLWHTLDAKGMFQAQVAIGIVSPMGWKVRQAALEWMDMLLDQIVCGVRDLRLQRRLLAKKDLNLSLAMEEALAAELSAQSAAEIQGTPLKPSSSTIHSEERNNFAPKQPPICLTCGGSHSRASCRFRNAICLNCQKKGHLARVCQAGRTLPQRPPPPSNSQRQVEDCYTCYQANHTSQTPDKIKISVFLEGKSCRMEVDTGSALSIISWETLKKLLHKGCLLWGTRVVIPESLRRPVLKALHEGHPGIVRMKALARSYVWWPGMDDEIAKWVSSCRPCQESRPAPPVTPPTKWENANAPWSRLHVDLAGPFHGKTFLIVVDSFSKWIDVALLLSTTTRAVAQALTRLFVTHGLPDTIVSDNGPQFTSTDFSRFSQDDWHSRLSRFLISQHSTPCTVTNKSPAELLMGRCLRTILDRLHPHYCPDTPLGSNSRVRSFVLQDQVFTRNYAGDPLWVPGRIVAITGPRSYHVQLEDGRIWRRHLDQ
ncbi:uncharacterized protein LOC113447208, partial [Pseudonaja textilis]|uniref:uncharacterized protein LOC113447208 n=1 Tax=Pseudonaja textilis TaxID=8673 RepID=UPI000EA8EBEC